jgi:opacity protein-like surface antigen
MRRQTVFWSLWALAFIAAIGFSPGFAQAGGLFYVSTKATVGEVKASFGASSVDIREWSGDIAKLNNPHVLMGDALPADKTLTFGAIILGANLSEYLGAPLRMELEISSRADVKVRGAAKTYTAANGQLESIQNLYLAYTVQTAFINMYVDWPNNTSFVPYIGGGLGAVRLTGRGEVQHRAVMLFNYGLSEAGTNNTENFNSRTTELSWHLDTGLSYQMTSKVSLDLGYRYLNFGKSINFGDTSREENFRGTQAGNIGFTWGPRDAISNPDGWPTPMYGYPLGEWGPPYTGGFNEHVGADATFNGPQQINFSSTHQVALSVRYSF